MSPPFASQCAEVVRVLAWKEVRGWKTVPATYRFLWSQGVKLRPPHFASWERNFFFHGGRDGVVAACLYFILRWVGSDRELIFVKAAAALIGAGVASGFVAAARYQREAEEHELPKWDELPGTAHVFD